MKTFIWFFQHVTTTLSGQMWCHSELSIPASKVNDHTQFPAVEMHWLSVVHITTEHTLLDCVTLLFCPSTTLFFFFPFWFILFPSRSLPLLYESPPTVPPPCLVSAGHARLPPWLTNNPKDVSPNTICSPRERHRFAGRLRPHRWLAHRNEPESRNWKKEWLSGGEEPLFPY